MLELIKINLGPFIGFLFTTATLLFIVWGAHRTERPGALEALQAQATDENAAETPAENGGGLAAAEQTPTPPAENPETSPQAVVTSASADIPEAEANGGSPAEPGRPGEG